MERRSTGTVIDFPRVGPMAWATQVRAGEDRIATARRLAAEIADLADADHWSISVDGVDVIGPAHLDEVVPRRLLQLLNGGKPATYRLSLPLGAPGRQRGTLRLGTIRPGGFRQPNIDKAWEAAGRAGMLLDAIAIVRDHAEHPARRPRRRERAHLRLCPPVSQAQSWDFPPDAC
jgi:hypothetical protein